MKKETVAHFPIGDILVLSVKNAPCKNATRMQNLKIYLSLEKVQYEEPEFNSSYKNEQ